MLKLNTGKGYRVLNNSIHCTCQGCSVCSYNNYYTVMKVLCTVCGVCGIGIFGSWITPTFCGYKNLSISLLKPMRTVATIGALAICYSLLCHFYRVLSVKQPVKVQRLCSHVIFVGLLLSHRNVTTPKISASPVLPSVRLWKGGEGGDSTVIAADNCKQLLLPE